jgi:hypothetical protein
MEFSISFSNLLRAISVKDVHRKGHRPLAFVTVKTLTFKGVIAFYSQ